MGYITMNPKEFIPLIRDAIKRKKSDVSVEDVLLNLLHNGKIDLDLFFDMIKENMNTL
jgi:hypothetical protein